MLLVEIEKYRVGFHCFGPRDLTTNHFSRFNNRHLSEAQCEMRRFDKLPKMHGNSFEHFELKGLKFTRYLVVNYLFLAEEKVSPNWTVADLMIWYVNHNIEVPFEEWLKTNPMLGGKRGRQHISLLTDVNGNVHLFFIQNGELQHEWVAETSFVYNGIITTLAEAKAKRLKAAEKVFDEVNQHLNKIVPETFDLPHLLDGSEVLNYVNDR